MTSCQRLLSMITATLAIALHTHAVPVSWTGGASDWDNPATWSPGLPAAADDVLIDNGLTGTASSVLLDVHAVVHSVKIDPGDALDITPGAGVSASLTTPTVTGNGGNGANATTPGGSGTPGSNAATLTLAGDALLDAQSLNFTGGLGGNGAAATGSGGHGATGGNGLTLNVPADSELNLHDGTVNLSGGNGGNGADGFTSGLSIGIGGSGGNGGHAGSINITGGHAELTNATAILSPGSGGSQGFGSFVSGIPGFSGLPGNVNLSSGSLTLTNTTLPAGSLVIAGGELTLDNNTYDPGATTFALPVTTTLKNNVAFTGVTLLEIGEHTTMDNSTMNIPGQLRLTTAASMLDIVNGSTVSSNSLGFNANAMLALHGAGTQLNTGSIVYVDITVEPTIEVSGGAALNTTGISVLRNGQITIQGPSTTWTDTGSVVIEPSDTGSNTLTIENGAAVNTASFRLLSNSQVILTGEDTTWDVGYLFTRTQSDNSLQINGGTLRIGAAQIHYTHLDWIAGTVHITGPDPVEIEKSDFDTFNTFPNPVEILPNQTFISDVGMTVSSVPGSTLTLSGGTLVTNYLKQDAAERIVLNSGTLHKTGPDPLLIGSDPTLLNALDTITDLPTGLHIIADDGVEISGDGQLNLLGGTLTTTTITRVSGSPIGLGFNTGTLHLTSPVGATIGGTQTDPNALPPALTLGTDAHLVLDAASTIDPDGLLILAGGTYNAPSTDVQPAGQIAVLTGTFSTGSLTNQGNTQTSPGSTTNITEGPLVITPGATLTANGTLIAQDADNQGTLNTFAGNLTFQGNVTNNAAAEINATNGTLTFPANDLPDDVGLVNLGTLNLINTTIHGDVRSPAGSLIRVAGAVTFNGFFSGGATFPGAGSVVFNGGFSPGDSPASIDFHSDLTLGETNNLILELAGLVPGDDHDQLNIQGTLHAAGELSIQLLEAYHPQPGDTFQLLHFTTTTGTFSQINLPAHIQFDTSALLTTGTLAVVPEPTTLSLLTLPLLSLIPRKRRLGGMDKLRSGRLSVSHLAHHPLTVTRQPRSIRMPRSSAARAKPLIVIFIVVFIITPLANATAISWDGGSGDWFNPDMWTPDMVPGPADDVLIDNGNTGTSSLVQIGTHATANSVKIDPGDTLSIGFIVFSTASLNAPTITGDGVDGTDGPHGSLSGDFNGSPGTPGTNPGTLTFTGLTPIDTQTLSFVGGSGGNGGNGVANIVSWGNGGNGGSGGNGLTLTVPTNTQLFQHDDTLNLSGGNGGWGGNGAGLGGIGGNGGHGGNAGNIDITGGTATLTNADVVLSGGTGGDPGSGTFPGAIGFPGVPGTINLSAGSLTLDNTTVSAGSVSTSGGSLTLRDHITLPSPASLELTGGTLTLDNTTYNPGVATFALPIPTTLTNNVTLTGVNDLEIASHTTADNAALTIPGQLKFTTSAFNFQATNGSTINTGPVTFLQHSSLILQDPGTTMTTGPLNASFESDDIDNPHAVVQVSSGARLESNGFDFQELDQIAVWGDGSELINQKTPGSAVMSLLFGGTLNIHSGGHVTSDGTTLEFNSSATADGPGTTWVAGGLLVDHTSSVTVSNGATFNSTTAHVDEDSTITVQGEGTTWTNTGNMTVIDSSKLQILDGAHVVTGSATIPAFQAVTLTDPGSTLTTGHLALISGDITVSNGALFENDTSSFNGEDGTLVVTGTDSRWIPTSSTLTTVNGDTIIQLFSSALAEFSGPIHITTRSRLDIDQSTLRAHTLHLSRTDSLNWASGTIHLTGPTPATINGPVNTDNSFPTLINLATGRTLIADAGTITANTPNALAINGGSLITPTLNLPAIGNLAYTAGLLHLTGPDPAHIGPDPATGPINTLNPTITLGPDSTLYTDAGTHIGATGRLNINGGTLRTAFLTRESTSIFNFNTGLIHITGPAGTYIGGDNLTLPPVILIDSTRSLLVDAANTIHAGGNLVLLGGTYAAASTNTEPGGKLSLVLDTLEAQSMTHHGTAELSLGTTTNITPGPLLIGPSGVVSANGTLQAQASTNEGQLSTIAGNLTFAGNVTNNVSAVINATNATLTFPANDLPDDVGLTNLGTLNLINTTINGDVRSPAGSLINVAGAVTFNGFFSGAATFPGAGTVIFNGGFSPGDSPAAIDFHNDLTLGPTNNLILELAGTVPGKHFRGHDQINIQGTLHAAGVLSIELLNNYTPSLGDTFQLLTSTNSTGAFSTINLPDLHPALAFDTAQLLTTGQLTVIPEPASLTVILGAVGSLHLTRKRKQAMNVSS